MALIWLKIKLEKDDFVDIKTVNALFTNFIMANLIKQAGPTTVFYFLQKR